MHKMTIPLPEKCLFANPTALDDPKAGGLASHVASPKLFPLRSQQIESEKSAPDLSACKCSVQTAAKIPLYSRTSYKERVKSATETQHRAATERQQREGASASSLKHVENGIVCCGVDFHFGSADHDTPRREACQSVLSQIFTCACHFGRSEKLIRSY